MARNKQGSKPMWVALSFLNMIGPLAYFAFGRKRHERAPHIPG
jgi:Phospholipase_D-nuclease N-terminal